jgi:Protein of unknown function DUF72
MSCATVDTHQDSCKRDERPRTGPPGIWIGTSGWTYADWRGPFYPAAVPKRQWLRWYAKQFATTEVNGSFYRTPSLVAGRCARQAWVIKQDH